jgi:hypothetical protein
MKTKFTVCGNCQALPISNLLKNNPEFSQTHEYVPFPKPNFLLNKDDYEDVKSVLKQVDIFIYQQTSDAFGKLYNSENLCSLTPKSCIKISYPSIYFMGYFPELLYLRKSGDAANKFSDYHDANIINFYLSDKSTAVERSIAAIMDPTYYSEEQLLTNAENSIKELEKREKNLTITISDFIKNNWLKEQLFFSMNHPNRKVLNEVTSRILNYLGIKNTYIAGDYEHLGETRVPIYESVKKLINNKNNSYEIKINGVHYPLSNYVENAVAVYNTVNQDLLRNNLLLLNKYQSRPKISLNSNQLTENKTSIKTVYVHIGMSKTGSTAIQKNLKNNYEILKKNGILYPINARLNGDNHNTLEKFIKYNNFPEQAKLFLEEINNASESKILISSELFERMNENKWITLKNFLKPHTIKIIIYLRPQDEAIISMYNELVKKHACSISFSQYLKETPRLDLLNYQSLLLPLEKIFGRENLIVKSYTNNNHIEDFYKTIEYIPKDITITHNTSNSSLSPITIAVMQKINSITEFNVDHAKDYALACKLATIVDNIVKSTLDNHEVRVYFQNIEELNTFNENFLASNNYISKHFLCDLPLNTNKEWKNLPILTEEKLNLIVSKVFKKLIELILTKDLSTNDYIALIGTIWNINLKSEKIKL